MAATVMNGSAYSNSRMGAMSDDPFTDTTTVSDDPRPQRYSSYLDTEFLHPKPVSSPSQLKRTLQAHLAETERRLQDTQKLGTALLQQQGELTEKLRDVEGQQDDAEVPPELRERLAELEREHNDVGKEIARALLLPKSRQVSGEDKAGEESPAHYASQATGSPTKVSVPGRKQRIQSSDRTHDIRFAADISTSLLAQMRNLQGILAEREEALKNALADKVRLEQETESFSQRLRGLDENERRYKDENWNLETQNHELLEAQREAADREKRLNASLAAALLEKNRAQSELEDTRQAHGQLMEEHTAARKAHDSELHGLKRSVDVADNERTSLQTKIDELTAQNQELARAVAARYRALQAEQETDVTLMDTDMPKDLETLEDSPPPSPTKATPRHGGLESETLRSSLHHAHRMIQNLKGNIHREKTEKIELKRMLQDARDELEQRGAEGGPSSGNKRQKTRSDMLKKPVRGEMLGTSRRPQTDVELEDPDWEDHAVDSPSARAPAARAVGAGYSTATETEGAFETADETHGTESEDFETGAESLAGDSAGDATETEDTIERGGTLRGPRSSLAHREAGNRSSYRSTASTSAGEEEDELRTPIQALPPRFRLKNGRQALAPSSRPLPGTFPESYRGPTPAYDSPSTNMSHGSPAPAEQSLAAELGQLDDAGSDRFDTPGRSSVVYPKSTAGFTVISDGQDQEDRTSAAMTRPHMVDAGTMTESMPAGELPKRTMDGLVEGAAMGGLAGYALGHHDQPPSPTTAEFPLPPTHADSSNQYASSKLSHQSPVRSDPNFVTPPKTVWDEAQDGGARQGPSEGDPTSTQPQRPGAYSGVVSQDTAPATPQKHHPSPRAAMPVLGFSGLHAQEIPPVEAAPSPYVDSPTVPASEFQMRSTQPSTSKQTAVGTGMLASAAAALGFARSRDAQAPSIAEDDTSTPPAAPATSANAPLKDVSGNAGVPQHDMIAQKGMGQDIKSLAPPNHHQGAQTILTGDQIDRALHVNFGPQASVFAVPPTTPRSSSRSRDAVAAAEAAPLLGSTSPGKRPASASSLRGQSQASAHPPLPTDHRTAIAKAVGRATSPVPTSSNSGQLSNIMGPPIAPASAYRRPKTPAEQITPTVQSPSRAGTTPRASRLDRSTMGSRLSHRSSVSSFASEIDERFNIRADQPAASHGFEATPGTDPRMIQAITQTMIGEFLWKYTRKAGRPDMSNTRHRRYFWVHPYTKTLYWSDQDPQMAGRNELKAKSVKIESVRVVSDDNPMPPGLHRKSLEVMTPGRKVKFTASTSQRHETWFNALSYLLLRGEDPAHQGGYTAGGNEITNEDVDEFNAGYERPSLPRTNSKVSMSSYNSRGTSTHRDRSRTSMRQSLPSGVVTASTSRAPQDSVASRRTVVRHSTTGDGVDDKDRTVRGTSSSRFSRMMGSISGASRRNTRDATDEGTQRGGSVPNAADGSIYDASVVSSNHHDSAEDLRRELLQQERESDRLENVRACCDGKHDVSHLSHSNRHGSHASHGHKSIERLTSSVSRRPVGVLTKPNVGTAAHGQAVPASSS